MLQHARLAGKPLNSYSLAFILGPRINAVGRMEEASAALKLFLTRDEAEAHGLASQLERCNSERKAEQDRIMAEAVELLDRKDIDPGSSPGLRVIVLSREGWNSGVIGIVAGKICETYGRPAILISRDEASGMGRGSARSIDAFNMYDALRACSTLLGRFGGHALAAGLSIPLANLDEFEERINALGLEQISEEELLPRIELEGELVPTDITRELACVLASMEPFGTGNPEPIFMTRSLAVVRRERVGDGSHLKMLLQGDGAHPVSCIAFRMGELADTLQLGSAVDLCYSIRLNTFNGTETVELVAKAIRNSNA
jgi:single-stranded-DNA-specific exonuclease